jgi:hypothetical protein
LSHFIVILFVLTLLAGVSFALYRQITTIRANQRLGKRARQQRLLSPDWALYAQHLQRAVPAELITLYGEFALLMSELETTQSDNLMITEFFPIDSIAVDEQKMFQPEGLEFDCLPFATASDVELFLKPGAHEVDCVYAFQDGALSDFCADIKQLRDALQACAR